MTQKTQCVVKTILRDNRDNSVSILVHDMYLDLDDSVEDQVHDFFPMHTVLDFKWSEDLNAFNTAPLPLKNAEDDNDEEKECSVYRMRSLGSERHFYI